MIQFLFQCLELFGSICHIAFKFSSLFQCFQNLLTLLVIFKIGLLHQFLEIIIVSIRHYKLFRRNHSRVFQAVLSRIVKNQIITYEIEQDIRQFFLLDSNIRHFTTSVTYFTSGSSIEYVSQTVGNRSHTSIFVPVLIVDRLHTTSAWDIIFGSSHFHHSSIR